MILVSWSSLVSVTHDNHSPQTFCKICLFSHDHGHTIPRPRDSIYADQKSRYKVCSLYQASVRVLKFTQQYLTSSMTYLYPDWTSGPIMFRYLDRDVCFPSVFLSRDSVYGPVNHSYIREVSKYTHFLCEH